MDLQVTDEAEFLVDWATRQEDVRGMLLTSTRAVQGAVRDRLSDFDVILIVRNVRARIEAQEWISDFGDVLVAYWDPVEVDPDFGFDVGGNIVQYTGELKIDFSLWPGRLPRSVSCRLNLMPDIWCSWIRMDFLTL